MSSGSTSPLLLGAIASVGLLALAACGSGSSDAASDDQIASLGTVAAAADDSGEASQGSLSADDAALAFSECLREQGLDVADIGVDADGNIDLRSAFENIDPQDEDARTAMQACQEVLGDVGFGGAGRGPNFDDAALSDAFLEFSDCIREQGFEDVPDLSFQAPGGGGPGGNAGGAPDGSVPDGSPPPLGEGERPTGFGDRSAIFAEGLGLDPDDPEVIAAIETCSPIIEQAFSDSGAGGGPAAASDDGA